MLADKGLTGLFEGDIVLTPGQKELLRKLNEEDGGVSEQAIRAHFLYRWENGVVPYVLEKSLSKLFLNVRYLAICSVSGYNL